MFYLNSLVHFLHPSLFVEGDMQRVFLSTSISTIIQALFSTQSCFSARESLTSANTVDTHVDPMIGDLSILSFKLIFVNAPLQYILQP